jgi:uncharacterized protein DUF4175
MSHPLEQRLRQVRRRLRGLLALYGVAWVVGCVLGAVILTGLVDYLLRFRDPGIRLFCTLTIVGLAVWAVRRYLVQILSIPWHDADLARRLGHIFPALGDALPSAIEFLHQREDDPTAGSFGLRRAVVVQTTAEVEKINLLDAVRVGPVGKAVGAASILFCIALGIVVAAPASASVALSRLANPFGETVWPQTTHLAILQSGPAPPLRVVPNDTFSPNIRSLSNAALPDSLRIQYRFETNSASPRDEMRITQAAEIGRYTRRTNVQIPFSFRFVVGNEPWSDWCDVHIDSSDGVSSDTGLQAFSRPVLVAVVLPTPDDGEGEASDDARRLVALLEQNRVERVARGSAFEAEFVDARGISLPGKARVFYRWEDDEGRMQEEEGTVQHLGSRLRVRRENVSRSFSYRVEAGDDHQMPWIPVQVVPAPRIEQHETRVTPPAYTGLPIRKSETLVRALIGSRVHISATANRELSSGTFCSEEGDRLACSMSGSGRTVDVDFDVDRSTTYWFELMDREGLEGGRVLRWDVRAIPDAPPTVTIEEPSGNLFVTPQAKVPLRIGVKDDLAVQRIKMLYTRDDAETSETVLLYERAGDVEPPEDLSTGEVRTVDYTWPLTDLALQPGSQIALHVEATDDLPQTGRSETRRVSIITAEELAERIATRQAMILSELARVLEMQRGCRRQTVEMEIRIRETSALAQPDIDQLRGAELNQRQVNRTLTAAGEGVPMHVAGLLADLDSNGIDNPDVRRRMEEILFELDVLGKQHLPQITLSMTAAIKGAQIQLEQPSQAGTDEVATPLASAGVHQDAVISALEDMLGRLAQWENYRQFHRRVAQLLREQKELASQTSRLAQNTLGKAYRDLKPQEIADGKIQSRRQSELGRDLDRIEDEMRRSAGELQTSDPLAAETLADALAESRRQSLSATMHDAGQAVGENRMGQATAQQKRVIEGLERVLDILGNRREYELARLIRRLQQAEQELDALAQRQGQLQEQMAEAAKTEDEATRRRQLAQLEAAQEELKKEAEQASRQLERLSADDAAQTTKDAQKSMEQSGDSAKKGEGEGAAKKADEARERLEKAKQQLEERRRQAEAELAFEQLARLEDGLRALRRRQQAALEGTQRLDQLRALNEGLSEAQQATLASLAREQALLQEETGRTRDNLSAAAVFHLVLTQTADDMASAHESLQQKKTGAKPQQAQTSALARLDQIIEALQPVEPDEQESDENEGGGQGQGQGQKGPKAPGDALKAMAELKLLKLMQIGINAQTQALDQQYGAGDALPAEARQEYARLSREQGHLADLLLGLMQEMDAPEDNPVRLPSLDPDGPNLDLEEVQKW